MNTSQRKELTRFISISKILKYVIVLVIILALFGELETLEKTTNNGDAVTVTGKHALGRESEGKSTDGEIVISSNVIAPGELPGYTGWARPENTLARSFSIHSISSSTIMRDGSSQVEGVKGREYVIIVKCEGHKDCVNSNIEKNGDSDYGSKNGTSLFFLRAYGPAVMPGSVTSRSCGGRRMDKNFIANDRSGCYYEISFVFYDPGPYTIEVVLTFSNPPPIASFPLGDESYQQEPHYEGYLLPGFPLIISVVLDDEIMSQHALHQKTKESSFYIGDNIQGNQLCKSMQLLETSPTSAMEKARWKVTAKVNGMGYLSKTMNSSTISTIGYINTVNSLGITMDYRYMNGCLIIPESSFEINFQGKSPLSVRQRIGRQQKIHILYIGDSVLRIQKDMLQDFLKGIPKTKVEFSFLSLHGGYRKNQVLGPTDVEKYLNDLRRKTAFIDASKSDEDKVVILVNTGLHDIHRLCGMEFKDERPTYLDKDRLSNGSFACVDEYRALLKDFLRIIDGFPAVLKVFQTTTAAWPKYGNYGIGWKPNAQDMVLTSDFCAAFNEIAFEVLADYKKSNIHVMDGYWITYSRPDNREIGDIGNRLSHPGSEVLSVMTRKWIMLILEKVSSSI